MSESPPTVRTPTVASNGGDTGRPTAVDPPVRTAGADDEPPPTRTRVKKVRLGFILAGLSLLAVVSTVFGMMMAVASDLPDLENKAEYAAGENSTLTSDEGEKSGPQYAKLTGNDNRILVDESDISPNLKNAVIAIEDKRFYEHEGVDYLGIGRALYQDVLRRSAVQGGSTITQQFVKNALAAQGDRSVFQKLRESALAYHLEREWTKSKVLTQYLNAIYFGNGAYGVESAVRTYFGKGSDFGGDDRAARSVEPHEAALLAAIIASPSGYDPVQNPTDARERRDLVLNRMLAEGMITEKEHDESVLEAIPSADDISAPEQESSEPYFSTWVTQQLVDRYGAGQVFGGGLKIKTTLDSDMQDAAEEAIKGRLPEPGPSASLVAIENKTGEVKALVGGTDFEKRPFNLATNGHRQPGSAIKSFTLIEALRQGISPEKTYESGPKILPYPGRPDSDFRVENYEGSYLGTASIATAIARSDNSIFAELGLEVGTPNIARLAKDMGIRTPLSTNPSMTLGGLEQGVTPLEMAFAYSTIANGGKRVSGSLASSPRGPVGIERVEGLPKNTPEDQQENRRRSERVYPENVGEQAKTLLGGVVSGGTGVKAALGEFTAGKTGTTENYGDAWFCGFTEEITTCVWVGYPDKLKPMLTEYNGTPVAGGTFPAEIFNDFMNNALQILALRKLGDEADEAPALEPVAPIEPVAPVPEPVAPVEPVPTVPVEPVPTPPAPVPQAPAPQAPAPQAPAPQPTPTPPPAAPPPTQRGAPPGT